MDAYHQVDHESEAILLETYRTSSEIKNYCYIEY